jgi:acetyltransferase-like isoleucine patch superfamily enzyme
MTSAGLEPGDLGRQADAQPGRRRAANVDSPPVLHLGIRGRVRRVREEIFLWRWRRRIKAHKFARFGKGSLIVRPRGILSRHRIEIGDGVLVHEGAMFSVVEHYRGRDHQPRLRIGSGTNIGPGIWFSCVGEIDIGENIMMAHNVLIADSYHEYQDLSKPIIMQPMAPPEAVRIGSGSYIGAHAAILGGVTIGPNSLIGANAVVTTSVPPNSVVGGNPARVIRHYDADRGEWIEAGVDMPPARAPR